MPVTSEAYQAAAVSFTQHLADRAYDEAYAMTSQEYRAAVTLEQMKEDFETIVPLDWGDVEPIEIIQTMDSWPHKRDSDLLWVYLSIGGDVYSEALVAVLTSEDDEPRIREVEFGRP
jgi:hypothetical protein